MAKPQEKEQVNIVRIMGTGIDGKHSVLYGLAKIKGVGIMFSNAVCKAINLDKNKKISDLSEKDISKIEDYLSGDVKKGIPTWMLNDRMDYETGANMHNVGKDLDYYMMQLTRRLFKMKTYRGVRLKSRLPVRGQRTKSNFRRNKMIAAMKSKSVGGKK